MSIEETLSERGKLYGEFHSQAQITQALKQVIGSSPKWLLLPDDMKEALDMIASKMARILNGNPCCKDSWHDIAGYAQLVERRIHD